MEELSLQQSEETVHGRAGRLEEGNATDSVSFRRSREETLGPSGATLEEGNTFAHLWSVSHLNMEIISNYCSKFEQILD